ncbi:RHS repeat-associated core domain-containing protein, partial [Allohahella marinimesophila]|uniref:RHS repeat-associated core domain-containing protein n=1 Tax=Allohahella marinimesophila TaxID=1054972 RepID=UPI0031CE7527
DGLVHMGARFYDPTSGRFISPDPAGINPTDPRTVNRYVYANNNPYAYVDPDGRNAVALFGGVLVESWNFVSGQETHFDNLLGAAIDGYDGEGQGFAAAAIEDALSFIPAGAIIGTASRVTKLVQGTKAAKGGDELAEMSGMLRDAAKGKGNFNIGSGTREQADAMGAAWVGSGAKVASDGRTLVSKDGLRQYRPPSSKSSDYATTGTQANFERRLEGQNSRQWQGNGHMDIVD